MNGNRQLHYPGLAPVIVFAIGLLIILLVGMAGNQRDREKIDLQTRITAEQIKIRLESCISARAQLVEALAGQPWSSQQQLVDTWSQPAGTLHPLLSGVQALNFVDARGIIRVVYPPAENQSALNANLRENRNLSVRRALILAEATAQLQRTDVVELLQSGKGFAFYQQIRSPEGQPLGFANGVFRVKNLMDSCLSESPLRDQFELTLFEGDNLLYQQPESSQLIDSEFRVDLPINIVGRPWQMALSPLESYLDARDGNLGAVLIGLGLLMTLLLALATRSLSINQKILKDSEDKYRLLVENQTDLVVKVNPDGEFQYISPSYCQMFGKSEQELLNNQFMPLVHEDDRELTMRSLDSLTSPPHSSYHEQRAMTKNGWRWLGWSNTAVLNESGEIEAITAVGRDITEIKTLEEHVARSHKMTAIGEMAGGITHDFNNLLQVIIGNIECLLLDDTQSAETRETLEQVVKVVERAMDLTAKLSTLSRQEITRRNAFDLNQFLPEVVALLEHTMPASVKLSFTGSSEPLPVVADKTLIEQVLLNLCFNARDAIESHGVIKIRSEKRTLGEASLRQYPDLEPGDYALFTVTDDGRGIDSAIINRIFDPFFTTKASGTGTGLGLSNCYSIIKRHKGTILVDSEVNAGTCFSVYIPLTATSVASEPKELSEPAIPDLPSEKRALVADDDPEILNLTRRTLESAGFATLGASNGKQALELFEQHRHEIGLVVLDLVMPEMSGQEVAQHIRSISRSVKILFVTGYIPESLSLDLKEPVIRKPYKRVDFLQAITDLLE